MKNSALLVLAYYLSKFNPKSDNTAYKALDFKNADDAFNGIAVILGVRKNTVKNYRDTFDPLHGHRGGWHQRPMQPRYQKIADVLKGIDQNRLLEVCKQILSNEKYRNSEGYLVDLQVINYDDFEDLSELFYDLRSKAELLDQKSMDQEIPSELQEIIKELSKNSHSIIFEKFTSKIIIKQNLNKVVVPNIAFFMAIEALPLVSAVKEFNDAFISIFRKLKEQGLISVSKAEKFYQEIITAEISDPIRKIFDDFVPLYLNEIGKGSKESLEKFNKFIYQKSWKSAGNGDGKNPGRQNDTWHSPVLTAFATSHANQGFICEVIDILSNSSDDLSGFSLLNGDYDSSKIAGPRNLIVYGAPGTGKSHFINNLLKDANSIRTVFHSETQNSDFVGSLKPVISGSGTVSYEFVAGPFVQAFITAIEKPESQVHLIIEEINRANAAAVFGEIFQLLDRDSRGRSQYEIQPDEILAKYLALRLGEKFQGLIYLPDNLFLAATMNSSDQGVYPLDAAFKRRWSFKYMPIDFETCPKGEIKIDQRILSWSIFASAINEVLNAEFPSLDEDRLIGQWFLTQDEVNTRFHSAIESKIFIYLWNDVLRHHEKAKIFNQNQVSTFGDLIKTFNQQSSDESAYVFSDAVHAAFDRKIIAAIPNFTTDEDEIENDNVS